MRVPTGAVEEIQIEGDFDEADTGLHQSPGQQAALPELTAIRLAQAGGLALQIEDIQEARTGQLEALLADGRLGLHERIARMALGETVAQAGQQRLAAVLPRRIHVRRANQPVGPGLDLRQINVAILGAEKSGVAGDVGVAHHHVGRDLIGLGSPLVRHDGADGRINNGAAGHAAGVDQVGRRGVLAGDVVIQRSDQDAAVEQRGRPAQMFADARAGNRRLDGVVVGARLLLAVAAGLGIERVHVGGAASQPEEDTGVGLALGRSHGSGHGRCSYCGSPGFQ